MTSASNRLRIEPSAGRGEHPSAVARRAVAAAGFAVLAPLTPHAPRPAVGQQHDGGAIDQYDQGVGYAVASELSEDQTFRLVSSAVTR